MIALAGFLPNIELTPGAVILKPPFSSPSNRTELISYLKVSRMPMCGPRSSFGGLFGESVGNFPILGGACRAVRAVNHVPLGLSMVQWSAS